MSERYELIDVEKDTTTGTGERKYTIVQMCGWLEVSTSGYYEWRDRGPSATAQRREWLTLLINEAFDDSDETYGHRRIHAVALMHQLGRSGAQVICATHSPILAATPDADIIELEDDGFRHTKWEDLQVVDHWRRYLTRPEVYLRPIIDT